MTGRVLSMEIAYDQVRVVEIDFKAKEPKVYQAFSFVTPEGMIEENGTLSVNDLFVQTLSDQLKARRIRTKRVVFTIPSARIAQRDVTIPLVKDNKIEAVLQTNAPEYFPVDLKQYQLIHRVVERDTEKKEIHLSVVAVPNELLGSYRTLANACGLTIADVDYEGHSIFNCMNQDAKGDIAVSLKIDERSSIVTIINEDNIVLQRNLTYGLGEVIELFQDSGEFGENLDANAVMKVLETKSWFHKTLDYRVKTPSFLEKMQAESEESEQKDKDEELKDDATDALQMLISNIVRSLSYYTSKHPEVAISNISLLGMGARCRGLDELLSNELNATVSPLKKINGVVIEQFDGKADFELAAYALTIGSAISPMNLPVSKMNLTGAKQQQFGSVIFAAICCIVMVAASVVMTAYVKIQERSLQNQKATLQAQIDSMQEAKKAHDDYIETKERYENVSQLKTLTKTPLDDLLKFVGNLEQKLPSNVQVTVMSATPSEFVISVNTDIKYTALDVLVMLRECDPLVSFTVQDIKETVDEANNVREEFSVTCILKSMREYEEQQNAQAAAAASGTGDTTDSTGTENTTENTGTNDTAGSTDTGSTAGSTGTENTAGSTGENTTTEGSSTDTGNATDSNATDSNAANGTENTNATQGTE